MATDDGMKSAMDAGASLFKQPEGTLTVQENPNAEEAGATPETPSESTANEEAPPTTELSPTPVKVEVNAPPAAKPDEEKDHQQLAEEKPDLTNYIDPEILAHLKKKALGKFSIYEAIALSGLAAIDKKAAQALIARKHTESADALRTLASLQAQVGMYQREVTRQSAAEKAATIKSETTDKKTKATVNGQLVRDALKGARIAGAAVPAPPAGDLLQDDDTVRSWLEAADENIQEKTRKRQQLDQAKSFFLEAAKAGGKAPASVENAWKQAVLANGFSEQDYVAEFSGVGTYLKSVAQQANDNRSAVVSLREAQQKSLTDAIGRRDAAEQRATQAIQARNTQSFLTAMGFMEAERRRTQLEINKLMLQMQGKDVTPQQMQAATEALSNLNAFNFDLETKYATLQAAAQANMNVQDPVVLFSDAFVEEIPFLTANLPPGTDVDDFLKKNPNNPVTKAFRQRVLSRIQAGRKPEEVRQYTDLIDRRFMEMLSESDAAKNFVVPQPSVGMGEVQSSKEK